MIFVGEQLCFSAEPCYINGRCGREIQSQSRNIEICSAKFDSTGLIAGGDKAVSRIQAEKCCLYFL